MGIIVYQKDCTKAFYCGYGDACFSMMEQTSEKKEWNHTYVGTEGEDLSRITMFFVQLPTTAKKFSNGIIFDINDLVMIPRGSSVRDVVVGMYRISLFYIHMCTYINIFNIY